MSRGGGGQTPGSAQSSADGVGGEEAQQPVEGRSSGEGDRGEDDQDPGSETVNTEQGGGVL